MYKRQSEKSIFQVEIGALEVMVIASRSDVNVLTGLLTRQAKVRELCPQPEGSEVFHRGDRVMYPLADGTYVTGTYFSNFRSENAEINRDGMLVNDVVPEDSLCVSLQAWLAGDNLLSHRKPLLYVDDEGRCKKAHYQQVFGEPDVVHLYLGDGPRIIKVPLERVYVPA